MGDQSGPAAGTVPSGVHVFVSHAGPDTDWAEWVAWQLQAAGYEVELDRWSWSVGDNFVARMRAALEQADVVVALLSTAYFEAGRFTDDEWTDVIAARGRLVPLRVEAVDPPPLLRGRILADLHGRLPDQALTTLLDAIRGAQPPDVAPGFPGRAGATPAVAANGPRIPGRLPEVWNVPLRSSDFSGRDDLLIRARESLYGARRTSRIAFYGMGGVGKTSLATEYAYRFASGYDLVWWIDAEDTSLVPGQLVALARELNLPVLGLEPTTVFDVLNRQLRRQDRWLVIYDNADDPREIRPWLPTSPGHVVITSRDGVWRGIAQQVEIGDFDRTESLAYLAAQLPGITVGDANLLATELGDLPLALAQAVGVIANSALAPTAYVAAFRDRASAILEEGVPVGYPMSLAASLNVTFDRLRADEPAAWQLLQILAQLGSGTIPTQWVRDAPADAFPSALTEVRSGALSLAVLFRELARYGLVRKAVGHDQLDGIVIHRLTARVIQDHLTSTEVIAARAGAARILTSATPDRSDDPAEWGRWEVVIPHVVHLTTVPLINDTVADLACRAIDYATARAQPRVALQIAAHLQHGSETDDLLKLRGMVLSQRAYYLLGDATEGIAVGRKLLPQCRALLGEDHPTTLRSARGLSNSLDQAGNYEAARTLEEDTLARYRRVLGDNHPDTLSAAANLASSLETSGDHAAAHTLRQDTLTRYRRVLGDDHPNTLSAATNLARSLETSGDHAAAHTLRQDTLTRYRLVLGDDHPDTLLAAVHLANSLEVSGDRAGAHALRQDTLTRYRLVLGSDHPDTLRAAGNLAISLYDTGDHEAARALREDTHTRYRRVLGDDHPDTVLAAGNLAISLEGDGEYDGAADLRARFGLADD